jgi:peroxiredoxin
MLAAGAKAPEFKLENLEGGEQRLSDILAHGPVLLALFKISCPVCQLALPYLDRAAKGSSLQLIAVSQNDERGTERFHKAYSITMPTLLDREERGYPVSNAFGIDSVPSLFLVEPDGVISLASAGFVKKDLEAIGRRGGVEMFRAEEKVPEWKAG